MSTTDGTTRFEEFRAEQEGYRRVFVAAHGPWPHSCFFCGEPVSGRTIPFDSAAAVVHHLDGDHSNDDPANLAAAHRRCHSAYHVREWWKDPEYRAKMVAANRGRRHSPEAIERMREAHRGERRSPETRAKLSASLKGNQNRSGASHSPEAREKIRAARNEAAAARASCVACRREFSGIGLPLHMRACHPDEVRRSAL